MLPLPLGEGRGRSGAFEPHAASPLSGTGLQAGTRTASEGREATRSEPNRRPPAGWSDRADDWLGPDAVWKRVEWATRAADRLGASVDARALAAQSLGPLLGGATRLQIERAADGPQALALLLLAPEFQRR